jgi:cell division septation protein DedD
MGTYLSGITLPSRGGTAASTLQQIGDSMRRWLPEFKNVNLRRLAITGAVAVVGIGSAVAQSGDNKSQEQSGKPAANSAESPKDGQHKIDQFVEAAQAINGPAGNPECVWLGRRVVQLVWVDDLDTAFRHLDLYDRFGCPGGHVQAAFRCLTRFAAQIDDKVPNSLRDHVHACWINPGAQPQAVAAAPAQPAPAAPPTAQQPPAAPQPSPQPPAK